MKKSVIPVLLLALVLTGCGRQENSSETVLQTEVHTTEAVTVPTEAAAAPMEAPMETTAYPETITVELRLEGEPTEMTMDLFDGGNYVIYIPQDMWALETDVVDGYLTDRWVCSFNDMIDFQVISFGSLTEEEAKAYIREKKNTYLYDESNPDSLNGMDNDRHYFLNCEIQSDGENTFAILTEFPMEAGDGFGGRTAKMMESFAIK